MIHKFKYHFLIFVTFLSLKTWGQDEAMVELDFENAYDVAYQGNYYQAKLLLKKLVQEQPNNSNFRGLYASTESWIGDYDEARQEFNKVLSNDKANRTIWISAIKNELYAKNYATALGLANKALIEMPNDEEMLRLKNIAFNRITTFEYDEKAWYNTESTVRKTKIKERKKINKTNVVKDSTAVIAETISESPLNIERQKNRIAVNNAYTVFDQRYDPMSYASISYLRKLTIGSLIPRINYSNRLGKSGVQYDLDFYPKITKGLYAYLNYGYSDAEIYPTHKMGGDLYLNLKKGYEFSAGGRYIQFETRDVKVVTNSVGYYKGNYYFSLRSYITPSPGGLTKASGNLLIRKYLKDAENYIGISGGFGFSPELRQFTSGDVILAETLLYIGSQRLSMEYQFTGKNQPNNYRTNVGVTRQELAFAPNNYFWSFTAGLTYEIKF
ncbi:MAG: YaiO family outer membrane beta-barrel protein [Maribacter sp.]